MSNDIISKTDSINQSASNTLKNIYAPIIENHIYHNVLIKFKEKLHDVK